MLHTYLGREEVLVEFKIIIRGQILSLKKEIKIKITKYL